MTRIGSVRAFIGAFLRSRAMLSSPGSSLGAQLARLKRLSMDAAGHKHRRADNAIPCHDDSAAFNAAHSADARMRQHTALLVVWSALNTAEQAILVLINTPTHFFEARREMRLCDVREGDGVELVKPLRDGADELTGSWEVDDTVPVMHTAEEAAEIMHRNGIHNENGEPFNQYQIRRKIKAAYRTIQQHPIYALLTEENA